MTIQKPIPPPSLVITEGKIKVKYIEAVVLQLNKNERKF